MAGRTALTVDTIAALEQTRDSPCLIYYTAASERACTTGIIKRRWTRACVLLLPEIHATAEISQWRSERSRGTTVPSITNMVEDPGARRDTTGAIMARKDANTYILRGWGLFGPCVPDAAVVAAQPKPPAQRRSCMSLHMQPSQVEFHVRGADGV